MPYSVSETAKLKKIGQKWEFKSEANLEDFVYLFLSEILGAIPVKRQFSINGQFCDILAVDSEKRLVIIELKNKEDRYVVAQITRYYDALLQEKPLTELIDYSKPVELVVISPDFHKDNLTDKKYSHLNIKFVTFNLSVQDNYLTFILKNIESNESKSITVPYGEELHEHPIPEPPRRLLNLLTNVKEPQRKSILEAREKILKFHEKIQEFTANNHVLYGSSKTKSCAEFRYDESRKILALFLWLPHVTSRTPSAKKIVARMRIWTDWSSVTALGHIPKGNGRMISIEEWKSASVRPLNKLLPSNSWFDSHATDKYFSDQSYREWFVEQNKHRIGDPHYKSGLAMPIEKYLDLIKKKEKISLLKDLINLALETWLEKI